MKDDLIQLFHCNDQSALMNNMVTSQDPPAGAWSHQSSPQSPLGKITVPELMGIAAGRVLTYAGEGRVVMHELIEHEWWPWLYKGRGKQIQVERTVAYNQFAARVKVSDTDRSMLLLELHRSTGVQLDCQVTENGIVFAWGPYYQISLSFGDCVAFDIVNDPSLLIRQFSGFTDVRFNADAWKSIWERTGDLWIGIPFRDELTLTLSVAEEKHVPPATTFREMIDLEKQRWLSLLTDQVPECPTADPSWKDTYYFAWQTVWANRYEGGLPHIRKPFTSPTRLHYGSSWWWDEAFASMIYAHCNEKTHCFDFLSNFSNVQAEDGAVPGCIRFTLDGVLNKTYESIGKPVMDMQPPVIGLIMQIMTLQMGIWPEDLKGTYDFLLKHALWHYSKSRDTDQDGLVEYHSGYDSSADQTQRWDSQRLETHRSVGKIKPTESVDCNVWISLLWNVLSEMADKLGLHEAAREHADREKTIMYKIDKVMWDEQDQFYYDVDGASHEKIRVKTPYGFMVLLSKHVNRTRAQAMVDRYLMSPDGFWCEYPLPSVSLDQPDFDPIQMWRGSTWINVNWMVIEGLIRFGLHRQALALAHKTVDLVSSRYDGNIRTRSPRIWEWFHPHTGEELGNNQYVWTALVIDTMRRQIPICQEGLNEAEHFIGDDRSTKAV